MPTPEFLEKRLRKRYVTLVESHFSPAQRLAAGLRALPDAGRSFASTQAAWRFYDNPRATLPDLAGPLIEAAKSGLVDASHKHALVIHDWSRLPYKRHRGKHDRAVLGQKSDLGYELQTALLIGDRQGDPIAPLAIRVRCNEGVLCSRSRRVCVPGSRLDEVAPVMDFVARQRFKLPAVHIVDAEADSVGHYRVWHQAGHRFLVRAKGNRLAPYEGTSCRLSEIQRRLSQAGRFTRSRPVEYKGRSAEQWLAEIPITLAKPARPQRRNGKPRRAIPGAPLPLRLIVSEVRESSGELLATWFLITNAPATTSADELALWYYWRWRVESYFKLLKSAGMGIEDWQQDTALAVARRLLVASMACVVVWQIARSQAPEAAAVRDLLVRLSGRQMEYGKRFTTPALLAGLWNLLMSLHVLETYDLDELYRAARHCWPHSRAGPTQP